MKSKGSTLAFTLTKKLTNPRCPVCKSELSFISQKVILNSYSRAFHGPIPPQPHLICPGCLCEVEEPTSLAIEIIEQIEAVIPVEEEEPSDER